MIEDEIVGPVVAVPRPGRGGASTRPRGHGRAMRMTRALHLDAV
ncbi:UNVERIFIED_ORG: hypothetical protein CLV66_106252 [Actinomadura viridilutea]